jgi:hypothetical protein
MFRGLLIWHSSYFAAALDPSNRLLEGKDDVQKLGSEDDVPKLESEDGVPKLGSEDDVPKLESEDDVPKLESEDDVPKLEIEDDALELEGKDDALELEGKLNALKIEGKSNTLELEEGIDVFDAFVCWLYTGQLKDPFRPQDPTTPEPKSVDDLYLPAITLCKIWVFADFRGIPALGNAATNMLHERIVTRWQKPNEIIKYSYENTTKESKLREFILYFYTRAVGLDRIVATSPEYFTVEFTLELLAGFAKTNFSGNLIMRGEWTKINRCQWHDHSGPGGKLRLENRN